MPDSTAGARREDEVLPALPSPTKGVLGFGKIQEHLTSKTEVDVVNEKSTNAAASRSLVLLGSNDGQTEM